MRGLPLRATLLTGLILLAPTLSSAQQRPLRPGDRILVRTFLDSSLVDSARVDARGMIVLPLAGEIHIGGLAPERAADSVRSVLTRLTRAGSVDVLPLRRVIVSGEVRRPGYYFVEPSATVREVIALAGGLSDIGRARGTRILRDGTRLDLRDWEVGYEVPLNSGDVIFVPRQSWLARNALAATSAASILLTVVISLGR